MKTVSPRWSVSCFIFYSTIDDSRFTANQAALHWFLDWQNEIHECERFSASKKEKRFISKKTKFDIFSMVFGFQQYCLAVLEMFPGANIYSWKTSQDALEQFFGQQRAQQGESNNPTEFQYGMKPMFVIVLGRRGYPDTELLSSTRLRFMYLDVAEYTNSIPRTFISYMNVLSN